MSLSQVKDDMQPLGSQIHDVLRSDSGFGGYTYTASRGSASNLRACERVLGHHLMTDSDP